MKVIFEFDTESENFNSIELERHKQADDMAKALGEILKKARSWDKYDGRSAIPTDEIRKEVNEIISQYVDIDKIGYYTIGLFFYNPLKWNLYVF